MQCSLSSKAGLPREAGLEEENGILFGPGQVLVGANPITTRLS